MPDRVYLARCAEREAVELRKKDTLTRPEELALANGLTVREVEKVLREEEMIHNGHND
jgi:hypothetical protein